MTDNAIPKGDRCPPAGKERCPYDEFDGEFEEDCDAEDFYDRPTEFEMQILGFKVALLGSVKQEYKDKMAALEKENAELKGIKARMEEIEAEHQAQSRHYQYLEANLERDIKRMRLNELMGENMLIGWYPASTYEQMPKCDKCDDKRRLYYTTPRGEKRYEDCVCATRFYTYHPEQIECYEFHQSKSTWGGQYPTPGMYFSRKSDKDYDEYNETHNVYRGGDSEAEFEKAEKYGIVFLDESLCSKYCDWLNAKETARREAMEK